MVCLAIKLLALFKEYLWLQLISYLVERRIILKNNYDEFNMSSYYLTVKYLNQYKENTYLLSDY